LRRKDRRRGENIGRSGDIDENKGAEIDISEGPAILMKTRHIWVSSGDVEETKVRYANLSTFRGLSLPPDFLGGCPQTIRFLSPDHRGSPSLFSGHRITA
jgi:hypothetical protein